MAVMGLIIVTLRDVSSGLKPIQPLSEACPGADKKLSVWRNDLILRLLLTCWGSLLYGTWPLESPTVDDEQVVY